MALILEVERPDGTRAWHRLGGAPLTVGRGLANDLILDDPYADARHARLAPDGAGGWVVEDLGSVNGTAVSDTRLGDRAARGGRGGRGGRVAAAAGTRLRVGRTTLRFRDADEDVGPALAEAPAGAPPAARLTPAPAAAVPNVEPVGARARARRLGATTGGRVAIAAGATGLFALSSYLNSADRSTASGVLAGALAFAGVAAAWAGLWAVASRVVVQRFHFAAHLALAAVVAVGALGVSAFGEWLAFFFPDAAPAGLVEPVVLFVLLAALVAGHLGLSSGLTARRRWRAGLGVAAVVYGIGLASALAKRDDFSDVPHFSGVLKPVAAAWVPAESVDEFGGVMRDLRRDVDELAAERAAADGAPAPRDSVAPPRPAAAGR